MDEGLLKIVGGAEPSQDKYTTLAFSRFCGGLQTQRSEFAALSVSRYDATFLKGRPDALIAGSNVEISNRLTLQRRSGLLAYGVSNVPSPTYFYDYNIATTGDILLVVDTNSSGGDNSVGVDGGVLRYSPTSSGIYINKSAGAKQCNFQTVVNTLYMGDGTDLFKNVGPNLLTQSNSFSSSPWLEDHATFTGGQTDPLGGATATKVVWGTTGGTAFFYQTLTPNYTPVANNTFTFSIWMKNNGSAQTITLNLQDQSGNIGSQTFNLTSSWAKYSVTATALNTSTSLLVQVYAPTSTNATYFYGAQLEVGGPATTTQITTTKPQGVYLWGIQAPVSAPTFTTANQVGSTGLPWQPNTNYNVGDTIIDSNGNIQYATNTGIYPELTFALTSVAAGTGVYTGTITGGVSNAFAGVSFTVAGFTHAANNGFFVCTASTITTLTLMNSSSVLETHAGTASAGVFGTLAGKSGGIEPTWNEQVLGDTQDGLQNLVVQSVTSGTPASAKTASVTFPVAVTANNSLLVAVYVSHPQSLSISDNQSNSYGSSIKTIASGQFQLYLFFVAAAAAGSTTINVSGGGNDGTYIAAAELEDITGQDAGGSASNDNTAKGSAGGSFSTGGVTTTNALDILISVYAGAVSASVGAGGAQGVPPSNYAIITSDQSMSIANNTGICNVSMALQSVSSTGFYNPFWTIDSPTAKSQIVGITTALKTSVGSLVWINQGTSFNGLSAGLTTTQGYQYYYAYMDSYTGHVSNVSPISAATGVITGQILSLTGATRTMSNSGTYSTDPQSDLIVVFRNTDGDGFFYQLAVFGNGSTAQAALTAANYPNLTTTGVSYASGTFTLADLAPDSSLNTSIFAPIGLLNSPPPAGLQNMDWYAGRMFGTVGNLLYFATGPDNAALLNIAQNGVPSESWVGDNVVPFNSAITRIVSTGGGLVVCTVTDIWLVTGSNLVNGGFNPQKILIGHGVRSYNAVSYDGSNLYVFTSDKQQLIMNPNSGSYENGFPIGDLLENTVNPETVYLARHVSGSQDNALFLATPSGWYRNNPNQAGASMSGEATSVWSPFADFTDTIGGIGAIASIETSAGVTQLLVGLPPLSTSGLPVSGPVLVRDLNTFTDNGAAYTWSASFGSFVLATPGKSAEVAFITIEQNNSGGTFQATQCAAAVLLDEISGPFEQLPNGVNDPPANLPSTTVLSNRFWLNQQGECPTVRHMQVQLTGSPVDTRDELLSLAINGALSAEQV